MQALQRATAARLGRTGVVRLARLGVARAAATVATPGDSPAQRRARIVESVRGNAVQAAIEEIGLLAADGEALGSAVHAAFL